jgi:hypothetical protein
MAGDNLEIEIGAKVGDALSGLDKVGSKVGDLGSKVKTSGGHMDGFFGGITGGVAKMGLLAGPVGLVGGLVGELGGKLAEAAKAADEEQIGMNRLYTSMQANIKGWDGNKDSVEAYISKQQELAFGDDQLRDSLNVLVSQTHNLKQAQELQTTAMDLARAKKIDLAAATKLVGKVDLDSLGILKKLGIEVTDHMTKEQALAAIRQQTAGQAEAYANTTEGAMTRLNTNMGNVLESVGHTILPKITEALGGLANFVASDAFQGAINIAISFISTAFDNLGKIIAYLTPIFQPLIGIVQNFAAAISSGQDPINAIIGLLGNLGGFVSDLGGKVLAAIGAALPGILATLGQWGQAFVDWIGPKIPPLLAELARLAGQLFTWLTSTVLPAVISKLAEWGKAFVAWVGPQIPPLLAKLGELAGQLFSWLNTVALPAIITKLAEWGGAFIAWVAPQILPLLGKLGELLLSLGGWILTTALPAIVTKLVEWGGAFLGFIAKDVLPNIVPKLTELLTKLGDWIITTAAPAIITKLGEWGKAFLGSSPMMCCPTWAPSSGRYSPASPGGWAGCWAT